MFPTLPSRLVLVGAIVAVAACTQGYPVPEVPIKGSPNLGSFDERPRTRATGWQPPPSARPDCGMPTPLPSGKRGAALERYDAFGGLAFQREGGQLAAPKVTIRLVNLPGAALEAVDRVDVQFEIKRPGGVEKTFVHVIPAEYGTMKAAGPDEWGAPAPITFNLPTDDLHLLLTAADAKAPITAVVHFRTVYDLKIVDVEGAPLEVRLPVSFNDTPTPAIATRLAPCPMGSTSPFEPGADRRDVLAYQGVEPAEGIPFRDGRLAQDHASVIVAAPPGGLGSTVTAVQAVYWMAADDDTPLDVPAAVTMPLAEPTTVPAAPDEFTWGPSTRITVPIDPTKFLLPLARARYANVQFKLVSNRGENVREPGVPSIFSDNLVTFQVTIVLK